MYYELSIKVNRSNEKGEVKEVTEKYATDKALFSEVELCGLDLYNNECDVVAIKRSNVKEFVNSRTEEEQRIYKAAIVETFINDDGSTKETKYYVALFGTSVQDATTIALEYLKQGMSDFTLVSISKTALLDIIE